MDNENHTPLNDNEQKILETIILVENYLSLAIEAFNGLNICCFPESSHKERIATLFNKDITEGELSIAVVFLVSGLKELEHKQEEIK